MTLQQIKTHLRKHFFMIFRYNSKCYSLQRSKSIFRPKYSLIDTDALPQQRNSLEALCEQVYISQETLLIEAIKHIEIPKTNDPFWETYEAIRHSAVVYGDEIHFIYNEKNYWIAHTSGGVSHLNDDLGNVQEFDSCYTLFEEARINGGKLEDIWESVTVDGC